MSRVGAAPRPGHAQRKLACRIAAFGWQLRTVQPVGVRVPQTPPGPPFVPDLAVITVGYRFKLAHGEDPPWLRSPDAHLPR